MGRTEAKARQRNPLEPLATVNWMLLTLIGGGLVLATFATIFGSGSIMGWGSGSNVCQDTSGIGGGLSDTDRPFAQAPGTSVMATTYRLCAARPTVAQHLWYMAGQLPATLTTVGAVLLTYLVIRHAERHGLYAAGVASRIRVLGWFLLIGSLAQAVVEMIAADHLLASLAPGIAGYEFHWRWLVGLTGLALLSFARIIRVGSGMREDLEGVV